MQSLDDHRSLLESIASLARERERPGARFQRGVWPILGGVATVPRVSAKFSFSSSGSQLNKSRAIISELGNL